MRNQLKKKWRSLSKLYNRKAKTKMRYRTYRNK